MTGSELIAGVVLLLGGGFGGKVVGAWSNKKKVELDRATLEANVAAELRDELREELAVMRKELSIMRKDVDSWRENYYLIRREYFLIREDLADALNQLKKYGVHVEMRPVNRDIISQGIDHDNSAN